MHTSLIFTWVKLCKKPEMNSEPTQFLNNGKVFPSLADMTCSYQCPDQLLLLSRHWQARRYWISWDLPKPNLLENNPNNIRNNMKSQIKNRNGSISCGSANTNIKNFHGEGYSGWEDCWSDYAKVGKEFHLS